MALQYAVFTYLGLAKKNDFENHACERGLGKGNSPRHA